jgi:hypothetical protein
VSISKINLLKVTKRPIIDAFLFPPTGLVFNSEYTLTKIRMDLKESATNHTGIDYFLCTD